MTELDIACKDLEYDKKYFPSSYHPNNYFPPNYWPAVGAEPTGGGAFGALPLAIHLEVEEEERQYRKRRWLSTIALIIAEV